MVREGQTAMEKELRVRAVAGQLASGCQEEHRAAAMAELLQAAATKFYFDVATERCPNSEQPWRRSLRQRPWTRSSDRWL
ncbi:unnamed protein product [Urochloa humidicola]